MTWPKKIFWSGEKLITEFIRIRPPISSLTPTFLIDTAGNIADDFQVYWSEQETKKD